MVNFTTALMNRPILSVATPASFALRERYCNVVRVVQDDEQVREVDPAHDQSDDRHEDVVHEGRDDGTEAAPIMTPIARSMTLPLMAKSRNSLSMDMVRPSSLSTRLRCRPSRQRPANNRFALTTRIMQFAAKCNGPT